MGTLLKLILLISLSVSSVLTQIPPNAVPIDTSDSAVSASYSVYYDFIEPRCVDSSSGIGTNIGQYLSGQSIENFIALIEKLEYAVYNSSQSGYEKIKGAEQMARVILRRYEMNLNRLTRFKNITPNKMKVTQSYSYELDTVLSFD